MDRRGFSLIELLIVVAIILIIAAIAVPSLVRARVSANEAAIGADIRAFLSAEAAFSSVAGGFGDASCLYPDPSGCDINGGTIPMIDHLLAQDTMDKGGYNRDHQNNGVTVVGPNILGGVYTGFCYGGTPAVLGRTGNRSFSGDDSGTIVQGINGTICCAGGTNNVAACQLIS